MIQLKKSFKLIEIENVPLNNNYRPVVSPLKPNHQYKFCKIQ